MVLINFGDTVNETKPVTIHFEDVTKNAQMKVFHSWSSVDEPQFGGHTFDCRSTSYNFGAHTFDCRSTNHNLASTLLIAGRWATILAPTLLIVSICVFERAFALLIVDRRVANLTSTVLIVGLCNSNKTFALWIVDICLFLEHLHARLSLFVSCPEWFWGCGILTGPDQSELSAVSTRVAWANVHRNSYKFT